jgi:hypothetical protein
MMFPGGHTRRQMMVLAASALASVAVPAVAEKLGQGASASFQASTSTTTSELNKWLAVPSLTSTTKRLTGNVTLTAPLVIPSGMTLDATGATVTGPPKDNILKNAATVPAVTAAVNVVAGSTTITAVSAVFTASMVGRRVQVLGAGPHTSNGHAPGSMYGTIQSAASAHQVVLDTPASLTVSNAKAYVFPVADTNVTIRGGTWINHNKNALSQTTASHGFYLRRVNTLTITGVTVKSTGVQQLGGQYAIAIGDCTNVHASSLTFTNTASDGIHVQGPASNITITNVVGNESGDDLVAFTGVDGQSYAGSLLGDVEGDITSVTVQNIRAAKCRSLLKVTSGTGANGVVRTVSQFSASGISGTGNLGSPINIVNYAGATSFSGTITNVSATAAGSGPIVYVNCSAVGDLVVDGVAWPSTMKVAPTDGIVYVSATNIGSVTVQNVTNSSVAGKTSDLVGCGLRLFGTNIGTVAVAGVSCPVAAPHFDTVQLGTKAMTINSLTVSSDSSKAKTGNVLYVPAACGGYALRNVAFNGVSRVTGSLFAADSDGTTVPMAMSVWTMTGGGAVALLRSPATVTMTGVFQPNGGGGAIRANSPAASPIRVVDQGSTRPPTLITRTASQRISAVSPTISIDTKILTPQDGDVVLGTTALEGGPGLVRYQASTGTWVPAVAPGA